MVSPSIQGGIRGVADRAPVAGAAVGAVAAVAASRRITQRSWLRGRVVLVTGGSRGLGLGMAQRLAALGSRLVICGRDEHDLEEAREELAATGAEVLAVPCDVGDREAVAELINRTVAEFGHVDALINNAGIITVGPLETHRVEDFEEAMRVMFFGLVHTTLEVLPIMRRRGEGRITNITSIGGKLSFPHLLPYNSAKFAAVGFSQGLRAELAGTGIKVTTVVPGLMRTGSHLNVKVKGNHSAEFAWFGVGATLPGLSLNAGRAARRIVDATAAGRPLLVLSPQAKLASRVAGAFPGLTERALGVAGRLLPSADGSGHEEVRTGASVRRGISALMTAPGQPAARKYRQTGDSEEASSEPERKAGF